MKKQEFMDQIQIYFRDVIPFNRLLGIEILELSTELVRIKINMRPDLVGNTVMKILHGGVTATMMDVSGGLAAITHTVDKLDDLSEASLLEKLRKLGTIDMRVDYLLPGKGDSFEARAKVLRHGRKVCVTRMELLNEEGKDIALGTATYIVG